MSRMLKALQQIVAQTPPAAETDSSRADEQPPPSPQTATAATEPEGSEPASPPEEASDPDPSDAQPPGTMETTPAETDPTMGPRSVDARDAPGIDQADGPFATAASESLDLPFHAAGDTDEAEAADAVSHPDGESLDTALEQVQEALAQVELSLSDDPLAVEDPLSANPTADEDDPVADVATVAGDTTAAPPDAEADNTQPPAIDPHDMDPHDIGTCAIPTGNADRPDVESIAIDAEVVPRAVDSEVAKARVDTTPTTVGEDLLDKLPLADSKPAVDRTTTWSQPSEKAVRAYDELAEGVLGRLAAEPSGSVLLTSPCEVAGASELFASLAAAVARRTGGPVLAVDGNLHRPRLAEVMGVAAGAGLAEVIEGTAQWQQVVRPTAVPGLSLLPGGKLAGRAGAAPRSLNLESLLESLRGEYRLVLIHAAALTHGEVAPLAAQCDGAFLIVHLGHTTRRTALQAVNIVEACGGRILGSIAVAG